MIDDEIIVLVDDDPAIRTPLRAYFEAQGLAVADTGNAKELMHLLNSRKVALVLLDIGLPDEDGLSLLPKIAENYKDVAVIMLTGLSDLEVALDCIRKGADDYLSKPIQPSEIIFVVKKTLEKRRLIFDNRKYQEDLEKVNFRLQLMHQLATMMNTAYLSAVELDQILLAILVGITANEGLRFNRAFLLLFDDSGKVLQGAQAIGTTCRYEAGRIWAEMQAKKMGLVDILQNIQDRNIENTEVNRMIRTLKIPADNLDHILIRATRERRSILVTDGKAEVPVSPDLLALLDENNFVIVPLFSPRHSFGVIIADNFITHLPIDEAHVNALEQFASQSSLAIEQTKLYREQQNQITELETLYSELEKNKDLLVKEERYSALGHMAAQMVHVVKNPLTSIGGVARIMSKKIIDAEWQKYLKVLIKETDRLESTLDDLFDFVSETELHRQKTELYPLLKKTTLLVRNQLIKEGISVELDLPEPDPTPLIDPGQIRQMVLHLVRNSIEAMPEGGRLSISVRRQQNQIVLTVADTGIGITESHFSRAKDPFFTTKTYGTGLGLSLVERVVKGHGGTFSLNKRELGLEAVVRLPVE